ncbi:MAG: hypothetical protein RIS70_2685 [Planctomycetota bacterium]
MKVWFNKVDESRRQCVEFPASEVRIGRDPSNDVVLKSPLVSRNHAIVRRVDDKLELENVGVNSCLVGEREVFGGETVSFTPSVKVRIWPFTVSFETDATTVFSQAELESHIRGIVADLEL